MIDERDANHVWNTLKLLVLGLLDKIGLCSPCAKKEGGRNRTVYSTKGESFCTCSMWNIKLLIWEGIGDPIAHVQ
jgi:hypothetical protein